MLNRRSGKRKARMKRMMHSERCSAVTRFARPLEMASNFGFIRTKVSRLTPRRADMLHERSVRGIAHIERPPGSVKPYLTFDRRNIVQYMHCTRNRLSRRSSKTIIITLLVRE